MKHKLQLLTTKEMAVSGTEVPFLYFKRLAEHSGVKHGCSTRVGGVSEGCFSSMNLGFGRGDMDDHVLENYDRICTAMGFTKEQVVLSAQVHETVVRRATKADCGKGIVKPRDYTSVDAQITNEPGVVLTVFMADCVPVFFYDPVVKAIGTAHAGWRGTIGRIAEKTVQAMEKEFGSKPSDMEAYIGVSICGNCYNVGGEVAERFMREFPEATAQTGEQKTEGTCQLDLWQANRMILEQAGVKPENIIIGGVCTKCHSDVLYSHRVQGNDRGSLVGFLMLSEE
ncbi:MAG: peptidoglycan editing factor PgeF [Lachnospiraceae bacterium]|nr:peptidoglycan editing factor PgeF [Lachnospiraceae bacterium]